MNALHVRDLRAFVQCPPGGERPVLLDVREAWERANARIELPEADSLHVPLHQLPDALPTLPRSQPIVCICHHGVRSLQAVAFLLRAGFTDVYNLAGGTDAWSMEVDPGVARY